MGIMDPLHNSHASNSGEYTAQDVVDDAFAHAIRKRMREESYNAPVIDAVAHDYAKARWPLTPHARAMFLTNCGISP